MSGQTKVFEINHDGNTAELNLTLANTSRGPEVQANELIYNGESYKRWEVAGSHNSFLELVKITMKYDYKGSRQELLDKIYYSDER
ncbi:hypothetical protein MHH28_13585 [Paenibacillus sp. FSL K6-1217]|uniref:hypothetical protein n=1 Tax=Paenibacillus sp. FSL K6-1217 TaxID=2921466 RepID=UPI0032446A46